MDPLSFTASLLAVIHAARIGVKGVRRIDACRKAPKELDRFRTELESLEALLEGVRTFIDLNPSMIYCDILSTPVDLASERIQSVNQILSSPALRFSRLSEESNARLTWIRYKHRLTVLAEDIKNIKAELGLRLGLVTASSAGQIQVSMSTFLSHHDHISRQMSSLLDKIPTSGFEATQGTNMPEQTSTSCNIPVMEQISNSQIEINCFVPDDGPEVLECAQTQPSQTKSSDGLGSLAAQYSFSKQRKCSSWCSCACHTRMTFNSLRTLGAIFGELRFQYNGQIKFPCNCSKSSSFNVSYKFPQYLLHRYVSLEVRLNQIAGPEYLLRVPHVLPPSHPLWHYSILGETIVVQSMYSQGLASPYDTNWEGGPTLFYAVSYETPGLAHFLLDQGVDCELSDNTGTTASELLWDRAFEGHYGAEGPAVVRRLLRGNDCVDDMGFTTLHKVVLGFIYQDLQAVLDVSMDMVNAIDSRGRTPLHWAVLRDDQAAVQGLLGNGADPNITDNRGFVAIHYVRSVPICKLLLKAKASINTPSSFRNSCALQLAVQRNTPVEVIEFLIAAGSDINLRDSDGETALLNAICRGYIKIAECLVQHGADVNAANISCRDSAIHFASSFDRPKLLPLLLDRGADYTALNIYGRNLGHTAARFAGAEFISVMARCDIPILSLDTRDNEGKTAKDYMNERVILTDREIGVHEAFKRLVASLSSRSESEKEDSDDSHRLDNDDQTRMSGFPQPPGAFPQQSDSKIMAI